MVRVKEIYRVNIYIHIFLVRRKRFEHIKVMVTDKTDLNDPPNSEGFWTYKLNTFIRNKLERFFVI